MKFIFSFIVLIVVPAFAVTLKHLTRRSEHHHDKHILQAIHAISTMTEEQFQRILISAPDEEKVAYIAKMEEELGKMHDIFTDLRDLDWFGGVNPLADIAEEDFLFLSVWDEISHLLPERFDENGGINFDHFLGQCNTELDAITYSEFNDGEFNMARRKVLDAVTKCEASGFSQALNALDLNNFDMNDAGSVIATVTKVAEILKEVEHLVDFTLSFVLLDAQLYDSRDTFKDAIEDARNNIDAIKAQFSDGGTESGGESDGSAGSSGVSGGTSDGSAGSSGESGGESNGSAGSSAKTGSRRNLGAVQEKRHRSWTKKISDATRNLKARVVHDLKTRINEIRRRNLLRSILKRVH